MNPTVHTLIIAPPGTGKTMLARRMAEQPPFSIRESEPDRSFVYRAAGLTDYQSVKPPLRAPHHTVSVDGVKGTLQKHYQWRPGEVSLAHGGTLFLDELPEFHRAALDVVHEALTGSLVLASTQARIMVPTRFRLICAMNPCPCGWRESAQRKCSCTNQQVKRYLACVPAWVHQICTNVMHAADVRAALHECDPAETVNG
jgi:magnesium chelatase family protein